MKKLFTTIGLAALLTQAATAQSTNLLFAPGKLAVLQLGDGGTNRSVFNTNGVITSYAASDISASRQTAYFIDQFDPNTPLQSSPSVQVAIPTNAANGGLFVNGNAGTEGCMALAGDKSSLTFAGYAGDMLSITTGGSTAPSNLSYDRGIGLVDAFGNYTNIYHGPSWYGIATGKTNPRGVATDGTNQFWGCGNGYGSLFFDYANQIGPAIFQNVNLTSFIRVQNNQVFATVKKGDVQNGLYPAGLYNFVDFYNNPVPYPTTASYLNLVVPANSKYVNCIGFDINPQGTMLYMADSSLGIQKYVKQGLTWTLAYNLSIPGYTNLNSGILATPAKTNIIVGVFSVAVDWSGTNPVVYATTADTGFFNNPYYGNRVIRINDTNTVVSGVNLTNTSIITSLVVPPNYGNTNTQITNIVYKTVTFTPDLRPVITGNPTNWSAVVGDSPSFIVTATSSFPLSYQWLQNGTNLVGQTSASVTVGPVVLANNGNAFKCIVSNAYGAVTSSVAVLTVNATAVAPVLPALVNVTNFLGGNVTLTTSATGTDPKTYQWYHNGVMLTDGAIGDGGSYLGSGSSSVTIGSAQSGEAGTYSVVANNIAGSASNAVVNLTLKLGAPVLVVTPAATTVFIGGSTTLGATAYGSGLSYQWYSSKTNGTVSNPFAIADTGDISGSASPTLSFSGAVPTDATNYFIVVSNTTASVTSAPIALTVIAAPAHSFVNYSQPGSIYLQTFDSLPINGGSSADAANPSSVSIISYSNALAGVSDLGTFGVNVTYSLPNTFDFAYPALSQGFVGGLGLSNTLNGWYGYASVKMQFGATYGDQSAGGILDFGQNYLGNGAPLAGITNRALGIIATTKTGTIAYGVKLINTSAYTLNDINLSFIGEIWRNNTAQQSLLFSYALDAAGTNSVFDPMALTLYPVNNLNVTFPTNSSTQITDGTQASNQVSLAVTEMPLASGWAPNTALWLVWQSSNPAGGAQGVAIDNVSFSAGNATTVGLTIAAVNGNAVISWPASALGVLQSSVSVQPGVWTTVTNSPVANAGFNTVTLPLTGSAKYFRLAAH